MDLPTAITRAATDRRSGANELALGALDGLVELARAGDSGRLAAAAAVLEAGQPAMAPVWHLARAARAADPLAALAAVGLALTAEADEAVAAAGRWLAARPGPLATISRSSLAARVLAGRALAGPGQAAVAAVIGADAVGPSAVSNAAGSAALAATLPTLVVATSAKLVPAAVFERLVEHSGAHGFEPVPLAALAAVVVGPEVLAPAEAGRLAAGLSA
jgi:hypothetical protein